MNKKELKDNLVANDVRSDMYNLEGGSPNEAYCLTETVNGWCIYYSERGTKTDTHYFEFEGDACDYFFDLIMRNK